MNKQTRLKVRAAALAVRAWALGKDRADRDLCGWCAICTAELFKRLKAEGIPSDIILHESNACSHVFLNVGGWVVDPTATQFGHRGDDGVLILHEKESEVYDFLEPAAVFDSVEDLVKYQRRVGWPKSQTAKL